MRPALDGVRALAIIPVLLFHTAFAREFQGGRAGVDLFFVLSGFLITNLLLEEQARDGSIDIRSFYLRRALRLGPAMLALLAFAWGAVLARGGFGTTPDAMARFTLLVLSYTSNWASALHSPSVPAPLGHLWSLAVEEQFYLLWPCALIIASRAKLSLRAIAIILLATVAVLSLWRSVLWHLNHDSFRAVFGTDTRAGGLLFGSALAVMRRVGWRISTSFATFLVAAGLLLYLWVVPQPYDLEGRLLLAGLQPVELAAGMLIVGLTASSSVPFRRLLESPPALWIGRRSYAIYLWHLPLLLLSRRFTGAPLAASLLGIGGTLVVAALSFEYVEQPVLRLRARLAERDARGVMAVAA
jgi:peptidoglycan/LPS O-acetylase OafA/YrhL